MYIYIYIYIFIWGSNFKEFLDAISHNVSKYCKLEITKFLLTLSYNQLVDRCSIEGFLSKVVVVNASSSLVIVTSKNDNFVLIFLLHTYIQIHV